MSKVNNGGLRIPGHVAIIMDGNGRWAKARGQQRVIGHAEGAKAVRQVVETATRIGIEYLTLYAFSANNWSRPSAEVEALMGLMVEFARSERVELRKNGVRVKVIGELSRVPQKTLEAIEDLTSFTADATRMTLTLAISYGGRQDITKAARNLAELVRLGKLEPAQITEEVMRKAMTTSELPDVDLLIRTGGEARISDFLLVEAAYAELLFLPVMWPEFNADTLQSAVDHYSGRERRFGLISEQIERRADNETTALAAVAMM